MQSVCTGPKAGYRVSIDWGHLISGLMLASVASLCARDTFNFTLLRAATLGTPPPHCSKIVPVMFRCQDCHQQQPPRTFPTGDSFRAVLQATILLFCAQIQSLPFCAYFETIIRSFCSQFQQKCFFFIDFPGPSCNLSPCRTASGSPVHLGTWAHLEAWLTRLWSLGSMSEAAVLMSWHFVISDDNYLHSGDGVQSTEPWRQRPHPSSSINLAAK